MLSLPANVACGAISRSLEPLVEEEGAAVGEEPPFDRRSAPIQPADFAAVRVEGVLRDQPIFPTVRAADMSLSLNDIDANDC